MGFRWKLVSSLVLLALVLSGFTAAAQGDEHRIVWQVMGAGPLNLPEGVEPEQVFPAPDGRHVAYTQRDADGERLLCSLDVVTQSSRCVMLPGGFPAGPDPLRDPQLPALAWSPDSRRAAIVAPSGSAPGGGLWVVDFPDETVTNLDDDPAAVDSMPAWSPEGETIAVERVQVGEDGATGRAAITLFDASGGDARELAALPGAAAAEPGTTRGLAWSPDGRQLAASIYHADADGPDSDDGIWLIDTADGAMTPLVSVPDVTAALQDAGLADRVPVGGPLPLGGLAPLRWSPDGSRVLFWAGNARLGVPGDPYGAEWVLWASVADGTITVLSLPGVLLPAAGDAYLPLPFQAAWSADGSALLVAVGRRDPAAVMDYDPARDPLAAEPFMPLDPAFDDPDRRLGLYLIDPATGEGRLLGHLPTVFVHPHFAAWGAGGDAILNGYHMTLAQTFRWPGLGFRMAYPVGWGESVLQDGVYVLLSNPTDDPAETPSGPTVMIVGMRTVFDLPPEDTSREALEAVALRLLNVPTDTPVRDFTLAGYDASRMVVPDAIGGLIADLVAVATEDETFLIFAVMPLDERLSFGPVFNDMLDTLALGNAVE